MLPNRAKHHKGSGTFGIHKRFALSPLLFITVMEILSWQNFLWNYQASMYTFLHKLTQNLHSQKNKIEGIGLHINMMRCSGLKP